MKRILIADDSAFMRGNLKNILIAAGYNVIGEAKDGIEAVEKYMALRPDLVTLDITMPNMDGIGALKAIHSLDSNAKVIMCSAIAQKSYIDEALENGAKDFILKPFQPAKVLESLKKTLSEH